MLERWGSVRDSGGPGEVEARLRRFDGEYRWFLLRISPLTDASGRIVKWCGVNTDVDGRRRAEDDLRARERRFRLIVDGIPALVTFMTPAGALELVNRQVMEYFGASFEELKTLPLGQTVHPDERPAL